MELIELDNFAGNLEQETYFILVFDCNGYHFLSFGSSQCYLPGRHPDQVYIPSQINFKLRSFYSEQYIIIYCRFYIL